MKLIIAIITVGALSTTAYAKNSCPKKGQKQLSCEKIEGHKKEFICVKGKISKKKLAKKCKKPMKLKKIKK